MKLSSEEKELILAYRKKKEEKLIEDKAIKTAKLKHNLYSLSWLSNDYDCEFLTDEDLNNLIVRIKNTPIELKAGTEFVCYASSHNKEEWYDNIGYGIECESSDWAKKHLINIKDGRE